VATATELRPGTVWPEREVAVARHLAGAGAPIVAPSTEIDPGPHRHDGLVLSFWELFEQSEERVDASEAGRALRVCHEALAGFEGELSAYGAFEEARHILAHADVRAALGAADTALLVRVSDGINSSLCHHAPRFQALHGDAHLGNVWQGRQGARWGDLEDTCLGPVEWDLACLVTASRVFDGDAIAAAAALDGYGARADEALLDVLVEARAFQIAVWNAVFARRRPQGVERLEGRLSCLRRRPGWAA
jgi:Ser/Thr protein kinase RdoA (MazF antagonist)